MLPRKVNRRVWKAVYSGGLGRTEPVPCQDVQRFDCPVLVRCGAWYNCLHAYSQGHLRSQFLNERAIDYLRICPFELCFEKS